MLLAIVQTHYVSLLEVFRNCAHPLPPPPPPDMKAKDQTPKTLSESTPSALTSFTLFAPLLHYFSAIKYQKPIYSTLTLYPSEIYQVSSVSPIVQGARESFQGCNQWSQAFRQRVKQSPNYYRAHTLNGNAQGVSQPEIPAVLTCTSRAVIETEAKISTGPGPFQVLLSVPFAPWDGLTSCPLYPKPIERSDGGLWGARKNSRISKKVS